MVPRLASIRDECVWKITFQLLDTLTARNVLTPPSSPDTTTHADDADTVASGSSLWDESKVVILQSIDAIPSDILVSKIIHLSSFSSVWETLVTHIRDAFLLDSCAVSAPALRCLEPALKLLLLLPCYLMLRHFDPLWWRFGKRHGSSARRWARWWFGAPASLHSMCMPWRRSRRRVWSFLWM